MPKLQPLPSPTFYPPQAKDAASALAVLTRESAGTSLIYTLELTNRPDNRLTPTFINDAVLPALDDIEREWRADKQGDLVGGPGSGEAALITVGPRDKDRFYSNGLDLQLALQTPGFFKNSFHFVLARLLVFPIPTVAACNGHAFAGGFTLALAHDYRVLKTGEGKSGAMMCMNEIEFGAPIPTGMTSLLRTKLISPGTYRQTCLGTRFTGPTALKLGIVDALGNGADDTVTQAVGLARQLAPKAKSGVWGVIKEGMYDSTLRDLNTDANMDMGDADAKASKRLGPSPKGRPSAKL